jgi:phosphate transport system permease protein
VLLSAPSIVIGLFVYSVYRRARSGISRPGRAHRAGADRDPVVVRTTDDMLKLVPNSLREAAMALGCPAGR